jgi:hypothetical protein
VVVLPAARGPVTASAGSSANSSWSRRSTSRGWYRASGTQRDYRFSTAVITTFRRLSLLLFDGCEYCLSTSTEVSEGSQARDGLGAGWSDVLAGIGAALDAVEGTGG